MTYCDNEKGVRQINNTIAKLPDSVLQCSYRGALGM
jgi:hypothetical protein